MVARETNSEGESPESKQGVDDQESDGRGEAAANGDRSGSRPREIGGRKGLDPTRYGDWEKGGRCIDF